MFTGLVLEVFRVDRLLLDVVEHGAVSAWWVALAMGVTREGVQRPEATTEPRSRLGALPPARQGPT